MPDKIAIIGSDSFLATYLVKDLSADHELVGYSRHNHNRLQNHVSFDYPKQKLDLDQLLDFNTVIYCAGSGIQAGQGEAHVYELNTYLPLEIALFLNTHAFKGTYITFGSYAEIGNNGVQKAYNEQDVLTSTLPVPNNYCVSKRMLSRFFNSANLNIRYLHLILPTIYGKGENPNRLIPYLVNALINKEVPKLTSGYQTRQYIHMKDVAALLRLLITSLEASSGIYNVPCYETRLVRDIIETIYKELDAGNSITPASLQRYDETMKYLELDSEKIRSQFPDWKPAISIVDSIGEYLDN
ncbi:NAD(P)-dependent oxidoreductase [Dyadobacter sp. CY343]|uniref:NAD-dependent epimerase/dehydratase family protein n=1 Tax=Dyadobacter sp. CY343 TaxID=2907299 RepID=UPI001F2E827A|nr:NAD(P)-dependent oxidoreductase [Dyadobacter sp. CY343]MCE7058638.1 NAD(P)-dependent oxidoreductase [Dyadobacter sp. CY343]